MNNSYFQNNEFPKGNYLDTTDNNYSEQSYIENILRLNKGKVVNAYVSFPDSDAWRNKIFTGVLKEAGKDHLIIEDYESGKSYLILIIYLNYVEFNERINYNHSYSEKNFNGI